MAKKHSFTPTANWAEPALAWVDIIDRYIHFVQTPAWRVNAFKLDGRLSREEAAALRSKMMHVLNGMASRRSVEVEACRAEIADLGSLTNLLGREVPKAQRCPKRIHWHFQRAFLFNAARYTCRYCRRSAWEVLAETNGLEPRTLRFELDHLVPKRKTPNGSVFDVASLVVACRSCNTIKGEMDEKKFLIELRSLGWAVNRAYRSTE